MGTPETIRLDREIFEKAEELAARAEKKTGMRVTVRQVVEGALRAAWGLDGKGERK
jgi:hypothetical protein